MDYKKTKDCDDSFRQNKDGLRHVRDSYTYYEGNNNKRDKCIGFIDHYYNDGSFYYGEMDNSMRHGKGTYIWADGLKYIGEWSKDKYINQGRFIYSNGENFDGQWDEDGIFSGKKTIVHNKKIVDHKVIESLMKIYHVTYNEGIIGHIIEHELTYENGDKYYGDVIEDLPYGHGQIYKEDGMIYEGEFVDGLPNGEGQLTTEDGDVFKGSFNNGDLHGKGTWKLKSGVVCEAEYKNNLASGEGIYTKPDGSKYIGEFRNNGIEGYGTYYYPDGSKYIGEFEDYGRHGRGKIIYPNGKVKTGIWAYDNYIGASETVVNIKGYLYPYVIWIGWIVICAIIVRIAPASLFFLLIITFFIFQVMKKDSSDTIYEIESEHIGTGAMLEDFNYDSIDEE